MPLFRRHVQSPHPPMATWLAWPTLHETMNTFPAASASSDREARHRFVHEYGRLVTAELRIETAGEYAGVVRVLVGGLQVASIPYNSAGTFRQVIEELHQRGLSATCRAELDDEEQGHVLLHTTPAVRSADEPFLPPINAVRVDVRLRQSQLLDQSLHRTHEPEHV